MNTTIDFNVLSVFMSFESVTYLHYFVGSDRSLHNCFTHSTASFFSLIPRHIIPSSRVYLSQTPVSRMHFFCNAILREREEASLQTDVLASDSLPRWLTNQVLND